MADQPPKKPDYISDADWAQWLRDNGWSGDGKVVRFDKARGRKPKPPPLPQGERPAWFAALRVDERGRVIPDLRNALIALRLSETASALFFDEIQQAAVMRTPLPSAPGAKPAPPGPRSVTNDDVTRLQEWLQHIGLPRIGRDTVRQAMDACARETRIHPLRDWLEKLEWDGEPRIGAWIHRCLGTPDDEYHRQIGSMFLIAMVARIYEPGCQSDYMIVLEGPQGEEKSRLCRALAGDLYFSDSLPPIAGPDQVRLSTHLRGKWLIEVSELSAFSRAETANFKAFITRRSEQYTPKYQSVDVTEPRQCLFIGTTNDDDYNRDDTGGRRFWPVVVARIDVAGLLNVREQLFAEATTAYREGRPWWPDRSFEKLIIAPIQAERQFEDAWTEKVSGIIGLATSVTIMEIGQALGFDASRFDIVAQKRVGAILRKAKWISAKDTNGRKVWRKPE